jgi:hypothetical protein
MKKCTLVADCPVAHKSVQEMADYHKGELEGSGALASGFNKAPEMNDRSLSGRHPSLDDYDRQRWSDK